MKKLIEYLLNEDTRYKDITIPTSEKEQFDLYRSLVNIRPAKKISAEYLKAEDEFLQKMTTRKGITDIADLQPVEENIYLWKGDITTLKCDAIVNAANSGMTGCYHPCHNCIDNCIHTFAGVRLRLKCAEIMKAQGHEEPTGTAKITPAYDLPCQYVIHTVGPIVQGRLTEKHCELLKSCYQSCLELAVQSGIKSIAFCCISTGVFGFPQDKAAEIAVQTVREFLLPHDIEVIFNVFTEKDYKIYSRLLG
ncbi:protein-ADP-ribose hydrolase [uncultured Ruminococcus sp.]|uniref:protein-ADP-ribose hydrolase n=1 Tax=uncultured Ruminococcus sp. TaxID=165186 RepID=UPI0025DDE33F|nr:protein-ADP-ribose hydrolase [uncultured Ruminococcus sp.]